MSRNKIGLAAATAAAVGALVVGGATLSNAATGSSGTATSSTSTPPAHTAVTGSELSRVTTAVKAKNSSVIVTSVRKDGDGSYDVFGTKSGSQVRYEVSADLTTITLGGGGHGDGGGGNHTPVTGSTLTSVTAAVKAKDSAIAVTSVVKEDDGSYDVWGTKAGSQVKYEVSADLKTITLDTKGAGAPASAPAGA